MTKKIQKSIRQLTDKVQKESSSKDKTQKQSSSTSPEPQTMEELLAQTGGLNLGMKKGETVTGTVLSVTPKEVLADIGKKSFGIIANWELEQVKDYAATLKAGDKIIAQVINPENELGYTVLSVRKTSTERRWTILSEKKKSGEDLEVIGLEMAKGGLLVEWQGLRGFIPGTQIDSSYSTNPATLLGKQIKVKVLEVDQSLNRLVLSQKASSLGVSMGA
ncbi:MAG: 30S ribosomal protein S1, partial [Parcubacteria group bacterium]|nr:30S ribosomal protein S1 [Parcubacteria group bacterium]